MKRLISAILVLSLCAGVLSGCDRKPTAPEAEATQAAAFIPENTAVPGGGLTQAVEGQDNPATDAPVVADQPVTTDSTFAPIDEAEPAVSETDVPTVSATNAPVVVPFAEATPQPNASVSSYAEISVPTLGFKFNHPADWNNIPGRSTVCYVQPMNEGTAYPARVAITMKKLPHKCDTKEAQTQLVDYIENLMRQYNERTFKVDEELDDETRFMGNRAMSTTYLAYDGDQEIQGYVILTYFGRYVFVYHFLSAYEDFESFGSAMRYMRDSVQAVQGEVNLKD